MIFQYEKTLNELKAEARQFQYFNLDKVTKRAKGTPKQDTTVARESYNKDADEQVPGLTPLQELDIVERHGKFWGIAEGVDERGVGEGALHSAHLRAQLPLAPGAGRSGARVAAPGAMTDRAPPSSGG